MAKGFRGKYFSFAAITATTSQTMLHARFTAFCDHFAFRSVEKEEEESPDDPVELAEAVLAAEPCYRLWGKKALHCNCIFRRSASLALFVSKLKKLNPCRCRFRKTGLAPPLRHFHKLAAHNKYLPLNAAL